MKDLTESAIPSCVGESRVSRSDKDVNKNLLCFNEDGVAS